MIKRHRTRLLLIALLIAIGLYLEIAGWLDAARALEFARGYAQHWWLIVILILAQSVLFTFALAGSLFLWIAAPLYPPPLATFILAAGGTLGGLGAYFFSEYLTADWKQKIENSRSYKLLHKQDNFFTRLSERFQLNSIASYLTTKNAKITKQRRSILSFPLRVLRALRGKKCTA